LLLSNVEFKEHCREDVMEDSERGEVEGEESGDDVDSDDEKEKGEEEKEVSEKRGRNFSFSFRSVAVGKVNGDKVHCDDGVETRGR
jgi:hypothetical protein